MKQKELVQFRKDKRIDRNNQIIKSIQDGINLADICKKHKCNVHKIYDLCDKVGIDRFAIKERLRQERQAAKKIAKETAKAEKAALAKIEIIDHSLPKRTCNNCDVEKNFKHFALLKKGPDGLNPQCKQCDAIYRAEYKIKHPEKRQKKIEKEREIRSLRVSYVRSRKNIPCVDCNKTYAPYLMDFDHLPGTIKIANVSRLALNRASIEVIDAEIAKCELVCIWCHATRTHERSKELHGNDGLPKGNSRRDKAELSWDTRKVPCGICNLEYKPYQMQFDHLPGHVKVESVSKLINQNRPVSMIEAEIAKCQVICCGCHRTKSLEEAKKAGKSEDEIECEDITIEE